MSLIRLILIASVLLASATGCQNASGTFGQTEPKTYCVNTCGGSCEGRAYSKLDGQGTLLQELEGMRTGALPEIATCVKTSRHDPFGALLRKFAVFFPLQKANACTPELEYRPIRYSVDSNRRKVHYGYADHPFVEVAADFDSFTFTDEESLFGAYAIDKDSVYFQGLRIEGIDRLKARISSDGIVTDGTLYLVGGTPRELSRLCRDSESGNIEIIFDKH